MRNFKVLPNQYETSILRDPTLKPTLPHRSQDDINRRIGIILTFYIIGSLNHSKRHGNAMRY